MELRPLIIDNIKQENHQNIYRVSAIIAGECIWFEANVPLNPSIEAFGCVMLTPSQEFNYQLEFKGVVDPLWYQNITKLMGICAQEFNFPYSPPIVNGFKLTSTQSMPTPQTGLCFSGGVDSFFSLLHYPEKIQKLIVIQGFDIPLKDVERMQFLENLARKVAFTRDMEVIIVRTNLRSHSLFAKQKWEISHNGGLAAMGFLLNNHFNHLIISSLGSKEEVKNSFLSIFWDINQLWSAHILKIIFYGDFDRLEKTKYIARDALVQNFLRICWKNATGLINCSTCLKCVCTRLSLAMLNTLDQYSLLEDAGSLVKDITNLRPLDHVQTTYLDLLKKAAFCQNLTSSVRGEVRKLIDLSLGLYQAESVQG